MYLAEQADEWQEGRCHFRIEQAAGGYGIEAKGSAAGVATGL